MKKALFPLLLLALLSLTGCVKEAYLTARINGEWIIDRTYTSFVVTKDINFTNLYTQSWGGSVTLNGSPLSNCSNKYNSYYNLFVINPDITLFVLHNKVYYKQKQYDAIIDKSEFLKGNLKVECSFNDNNSPVTILIDLKAPVIEMKKDCRYEFNLGSDPAGVPIGKISFNALHKINGSTCYDDIIDNFSGTWDISIGYLFLGFRSDLFDINHIQKYKYSFGKDNLILSNDVEYSQYHFYGSIPKENIKDITYTNVFKRK